MSEHNNQFSGDLRAADSLPKPSQLLVIAEPGENQVLLFDRMRALVDQFSCSVELVAFRGDADARSSNTQPDESIVDDELCAQLQAAAQAHVLKSKGFTCQVVRVKDLSAWVIDHCNQSKVDLVLKVGHRTENIFYQPTDWQLIRGLPCPLLLASQNKWRGKPVVLATVDVSSDSQAQQSINSDVLAWTYLLTHDEKSEPHVLSCIEINRALVDLDVVAPREVEREKEPLAKKAMQELLNQVGFGTAKLWSPVGEPAKKIPSVANQQKADLVVMGSVGRKGVKGVLLGNTAEKVLHNIRTDVLIIKPTLS